jgi:hypothetical protein
MLFDLFADKAAKGRSGADVDVDVMSENLHCNDPF